MSRDEAIAILREVVINPPGSLVESRLLEAELQDEDELEDFLVVLAAYDPGEVRERGLAGPEELRQAARETLHELGDHAYCHHGG